MTPDLRCHHRRWPITAAIGQCAVKVQGPSQGAAASRRASRAPRRTRASPRAGAARASARAPPRCPPRHAAASRTRRRRGARACRVGSGDGTCHGARGRGRWRLPEACARPKLPLIVAVPACVWGESPGPTLTGGGKPGGRPGALVAKGRWPTLEDPLWLRLAKLGVARDGAQGAQAERRGPSARGQAPQVQRQRRARRVAVRCLRFPAGRVARRGRRGVVVEVVVRERTAGGVMADGLGLGLGRG